LGYRIYFKIRHNRQKNNVYYFVMMTAKNRDYKNTIFVHFW